MQKGLWLGALGALLLAAPAAKAHELACEKTVKIITNDVPILLSTPVNGVNGYGSIYGAIESYPATVKWKLKVLNVHDTSASIVTGAEDPLLESLGFSFDPATPFTIPYGEYEKDTFEHVIETYEDCLELAALDGSEDEFIDNVFTVEWDDDSASCSARVECKRPPNGQQPTGATRTIGFWSTHVDELEECLGNPIDDIDLGIVTVDSLPDALGILWGSPSHFNPGPPSGDQRSQIDRQRFIAARQLLAAICNGRVFGTTPPDPDLISDTLDALDATDCQEIESLKDDLDDFNNSGTSIDPPGFNPGPATPQEARDQAVDPTTPSPDECD